MDPSKPPSPLPDSWLQLNGISKDKAEAEYQKTLVIWYSIYGKKET
jgi:hypothetical protein